MSTRSRILYVIDGGNGQKIFLKDTEVGKKRVLGNAEMHLSGGRTEYEYLEFVLEKLDGEGRKCLDNWLTCWNWKLQPHENPNLDAIREADRAVWRIFYEEKALHTLRKVQHAKPGPAPIRPDEEVENPILEPPNLEEFYAAMQSESKHASTNYLADLHAFRGNPKESLTKLATRFDEVADPLIMHKQMTSRHLALHFVNHIPAYIKRVTISQMKRMDKQRRIDKLPLVNKEELLRMAKENETDLLESKAEQRAATLTPPARDTTEYKHLAPPKDLNHKKLEERLTPQMEDRLGPRAERPPDTRKCNTCGKVGHIARFCRELLPAPAVDVPTSSHRPMTRSNVTEHNTGGGMCTVYKKTRHVADQCWIAHPEKQPKTPCERGTVPWLPWRPSRRDNGQLHTEH